MHNIIDKALVILKALPTYLVAVSLIAGILLDELPELGGIPPIVTTILAAVVAVVGVAIIIIRRVTPVLEDARGILPPPDPEAPVTEHESHLRQLGR